MKKQCMKPLTAIEMRKIEIVTSSSQIRKKEKKSDNNNNNNNNNNKQKSENNSNNNDDFEGFNINKFKRIQKFKANKQKLINLTLDDSNVTSKSLFVLS